MLQSRCQSSRCQSSRDCTGRRVDLATCKGQLLYELHDPADYITPESRPSPNDEFPRQASRIPISSHQCIVSHEVKCFSLARMLVDYQPKRQPRGICAACRADS
ncbi:MAG: hypothetical protein ACKVQT_04725 [Burkholderiales bacterium]